MSTFPHSLPYENIYDKHCQGPFEIFIQSEDISKPTDPLYVGKLLSANIRKDIVEIKKIGFSRILVQLKSKEAANNLISNPILKDKKLTAFIPLFRTSPRND